MIAALWKLAGMGEREHFSRFLFLASATGIVRGVAVSTLLPLFQNLLESNHAAFLMWLGILCGMAMVSAFMEGVTTLRGFNEGMRLIYLMHQKLGQHLIRLPLGWFTPDKNAFASNIAVRGTLMVAQTAMDILLPLIINVTVPLTVAVITLFVDWRLGATLVISAPLIYVLNSYSVNRHEHAEALIHKTNQACNERLLEFLNSQALLRSSQALPYMPLSEALDARFQANRKALFASLLGMLSQSMLVQTLFGIFVGVAVMFSLDGAVTPVRTLTLIGLAALFTSPLKVLSEYGAGLKRARNSLEDIIQLLETKTLPEPTNPESTPETYEIVLEDVHFSYEPQRPVLQGVNLTIPSGKMTALVGASGCGKSTLIQLIARFWDVNSGAIKIGGRDVRQLSHTDLMNSLALVFQQVYLFEDTLEANIRLGNPNATAEELQHAIELAGVDEIIARLPDGLQSQVGEGGNALSGGERQRVSIARALLKRAPIVLFDEATASLDAQSASIVSKAMHELAQNSTIIVIAHQLNTILSAEQIVFIDEGRVCEYGSHHGLLVQNGRYARFWRAHLNPTNENF